ncbi:RluA family pseudouridine synthase [Oceanobacillus halotolerans]|uniref:RluA family pseudouridine synthase n=1 Tax=Oceanobacillus halotolerans TaxID=2663380 RepID=UPI00384EDA83
MTKVEWTIKKEHEGFMIRDYLQQIHGFSRRMIKAIKFDGGNILVNGSPQTVRYILQTGDCLTIEFPNELKGATMEPIEMELSIVYEDDNVIVLNKPAHIATVPPLHHPRISIANGLLHYYKQKAIPYTVHVVTRLDRNTSGLLLVAKHRYSHSLLAASQKKGEVKRHYQAIVEGHLAKPKGTIDLPIGRKEDSIIERRVDPAGKHAITHYEVLKEIGELSLVRVKLETGRTHQIRVHFAHLNHPLAGDDLYGGSIERIDRHALHCDRLAFIHPKTKELLEFEVLMPEDMQCLID